MQVSSAPPAARGAWQRDPTRASKPGAFTELPQDLSALTQLLCLDLSYNTRLADGWQHLVPLQHLKCLRLACCGMREVPTELSALVSLSSLDFFGNRQLKRGWQRWRPLQQLISSISGAAVLQRLCRSCHRWWRFLRFCLTTQR